MPVLGVRIMDLLKKDRLKNFNMNVFGHIEFLCILKQALSVSCQLSIKEREWLGDKRENGVFFERKRKDIQNIYGLLTGWFNKL